MEAFIDDGRFLRSLKEMGIKTVTPIQEAVFVEAMTHSRDILANASTGSGKTLAYLVPIVTAIQSAINSNSAVAPAALILVPTKELTTQVSATLVQLLKYAPAITHANLSNALSKAYILVGTPSQFVKYMQEHGTPTFSHVVIDEADLLLSHGYEQETHKILSTLQRTYQAFLISATINENVTSLKQALLRKPAVISIQDKESKITHYISKYQNKLLLLIYLLKFKMDPFCNGKTIIFVNSVFESVRLKLIGDMFGIRSSVLHNQIPVNSRIHVCTEFNRGAFNILFVSDFDEVTVSRGIDFVNVKSVINYNLPDTNEMYIHRTGRTGRGNKTGVALSFDSGESGIWEYCKGLGIQIQDFVVDEDSVSGLKYRLDGAIAAVTKSAIKEALLKEIKLEIINSEKLKSHFENNPKDLMALRHDAPLHPSRIKPTLKHIPEYLLPNSVKRRLNLGESEADPQTIDVPFHSGKKRGRVSGRGGRGKGRGGGKPKTNNPLKSFEMK